MNGMGLAELTSKDQTVGQDQRQVNQDLFDRDTVLAKAGKQRDAFVIVLVGLSMTSRMHLSAAMVARKDVLTSCTAG